MRIAKKMRPHTALAPKTPNDARNNMSSDIQAKATIAVTKRLGNDFCQQTAQKDSRNKGCLRRGEATEHKLRGRTLPSTLDAARSLRVRGPEQLTLQELFFDQ